MGRMYVCEFADVSVTAADGNVDFWELKPATNKPIRIHAGYVGQTTLDQDANEQMLTIQILRLPATVTDATGGTTAVISPLDTNDTAAGVSGVTVADVVATSSGTIIDIHSETFNNRSGWVYLPTPEMRVRALAGEAICVRLTTALAATTTFSGTVYIEEL